MIASELNFEAEETGFWVAPNGKEIPYTKSSAFVGSNGFESSYIEVLKWSKSISVVAVFASGDAGAEIDSDERWASLRRKAIAKVTHQEFETQRESLLQKAIDFLQAEGVGEFGVTAHQQKPSKVVASEETQGGGLMPLPLVHSELDEYGFDPYEFRIYAHIVRRTGGKLDGKCFAKLKKTAEICKISVRKTQYALLTLCDAGLILKEQRKGRSDIYRLAPKNNWKPKEQLQDIRRAIKQKREYV